MPARQDSDDIPAGLGQRDLNGAHPTRPRLVTAGLADRRQDLIRYPTPERLGLGLPRGEDQIVDAALVDDVHLLSAAKGVLSMITLFDGALVAEFDGLPASASRLCRGSGKRKWEAAGRNAVRPIAMSRMPRRGARLFGPRGVIREWRGSTRRRI